VRSKTESRFIFALWRCWPCDVSSFSRLYRSIIKFSTRFYDLYSLKCSKALAPRSSVEPDPTPLQKWESRFGGSKRAGWDFRSAMHSRSVLACSHPPHSRYGRVVKAIYLSQIYFVYRGFESHCRKQSGVGGCLQFTSNFTLERIFLDRGAGPLRLTPRPN
jgi:hypothetical protein